MCGETSTAKVDVHAVGAVVVARVVCVCHRTAPI